MSAGKRRTETQRQRVLTRESRGKEVRELWTGPMYFVHNVANASRLLYIGVTGNIVKRLLGAQKAFDDGYTTRWNVCRLVYLECFGHINAAIEREKQLKRWRRDKKIWLIEQANRDWKDLSDGSLRD